MKGNPMKTSLLITAGATVVLLSLLVVYLIVNDRDPVLLLVALGVIAPTIGTLFGLSAVGKAVQEARIAQSAKVPITEAIPAPIPAPRDDRE